MIKKLLLELAHCINKKYGIIKLGLKDTILFEGTYLNVTAITYCRHINTPCRVTIEAQELFLELNDHD